MQSLRLKTSDAVHRQKKQRDVLGLTVLLTLIALAGVTVLQLATLAYVFSVASKPAPSLVQLSDGAAITVEGKASKDRSEATIRRFTTDTLTLLMSWTGKVNSVQNGAPIAAQDKGVVAKIDDKDYRVTSSSWQASLALSDDFRPEFLKKIAQMTPPEVFNGSAQVVFIPKQITEVVPIGEGEWRVTIIASLMAFSGSNQIGGAIPFNKQVFVKSVIAPRTTSQSSDLEKLVADVRKSGLEIYAIRDIALANPKE